MKSSSHLWKTRVDAHKTECSMCQLISLKWERACETSFIWMQQSKSNRIINSYGSSNRKRDSNNNNNNKTIYIIEKQKRKDGCRVKYAALQNIRQTNNENTNIDWIILFKKRTSPTDDYYDQIFHINAQIYSAFYFKLCVFKPLCNWNLK